MKKKLIALDMDGTFLTSNKEIPQENFNAVKQAIEAGHEVMICSGRPHKSLLSFLSDEGLADLPVSASNGTITVVEGEVINIASMNPESVENLTKWLDLNKIPFNLYTTDGVFMHAEFVERAQTAQKEIDSDKVTFFMDIEMIKNYLIKIGAVKFSHFKDLPQNIKVLKFFIYTPNLKTKHKVYDYANKIIGLTVTSSFGDNVEISDFFGHKGTGIKAVAKHLGIDLKDTIAMGDNYNDLGMLEVAGLAIAMENAEPEIKEIADIITLSNDECGVAHAIRKHILEL